MSFSMEQCKQKPDWSRSKKKIRGKKVESLKGFCSKGKVKMEDYLKKMFFVFKVR